MEFFYSAALLPYYGAALAAALLMWFIQRKDRQRVYLPLLKILDLPDRQVRRWNLVMPPIVPLLVSCALMAIVLYGSFGPYRHATVLSRSPAQKILMLVDVSPSLEAAVSIEDYRSLLKNHYRQLRQKTAVVWLDSYRQKPISFADDAEMSAYADSLQFHPWGVNLDSLLGHASDYSDYSVLVFSDHDQNAWHSFSQQFSDDRAVWWVDMAKSRSGDNIYIDAVTIKDDPDPAYINLEYKLSRSSGLDHRQVSISVQPAGAVAEVHTGKRSDGRQPLAAKPVANSERPPGQGSSPQAAKGPTLRQEVSFAPNRRSITSSFALSRSDWAASGSDGVLALSIEAQDSISLDNVSYFSLGGGQKKALLVTHQGGEKFIDSPVYSTVQSLKSLGFDVDLSYSWPSSKVSPVKGSPSQESEGKLPYQLAVVVGFTDEFFKDLCQNDPLQDISAKTPLWVIDLSLNRQEHLASSGCRQLFPKVATRQDPRVQASLRRNGYSELTPQLALPTFAQKRKKNQTRLVIVRNLTELNEVNYRLNVMFFYDLLKRSAAKGGDTGGQQIVALRDGSKESFASLVGYAYQNVPRVESRLETINKELLPPLFSLEQISSSGVKQKKLIPDSSTIFKLLLIAVIVLTLIDAGYRWQRNRLGHYAIWFAIGLSVAALPSESQGAVSFGVYRLPFAVDAPRYTALAKYVKSRTSLTLPKDVYSSTSLDAELLSRPMIIAGQGALQNLTATDQNQLRRWLMAGGILIADRMADRGPLVEVTNALVLNGTWQDVALDNELMRSFHLLASLPICDGKTFSEFRLENRIAILILPFSLGSALLAKQPEPGCAVGSAALDKEFYPKLFINILMTALTTDYKKDQIHLPEILKKLR